MEKNKVDDIALEIKELRSLIQRKPGKFPYSNLAEALEKNKEYAEAMNQWRNAFPCFD